MTQDREENNVVSLQVPQKPTTMPMASVIEELIESVANAIEERIGVLETIAKVGGPYESSQRITMERKLKEAAVAAIQTIVTHPSFQAPNN
jgi:hypothetical protein